MRQWSFIKFLKREESRFHHMYIQINAVLGARAKQLLGLSKHNGVKFLTYYLPIISRTLGARKFVQAPFDAACHAIL
jgi:hypothetical protein